MEEHARILAELGQGGSAHVWLTVARGPSGFSKLVVLKSMKGDLRFEPELTRMFLNEAKLAARLNHPNIVQTNEVFEHDGVPVIVMEYLDGQSLAAILNRHRQRGGFPFAQKLRVLSDTLGGLHAAHELQDFDGTRLEVVHRDVSPHNVFVTYDGQTKVIDFGIAQLSGYGETTESGVIRGKLHYMSPEQINAECVDRRADVYSAGVMLWEMAAGVRMWRGVNEAVVMNRVLGGELPRLDAVKDDVDPRIVEIVETATSRRPEDRYATAADFQLDIDEYLAARAPHLRTRDLGDAVGKMFSDRRAERRHIVERELAKVCGQSTEEYSRNRPVPLPTLEMSAENATRMRRDRRTETISHALPWIVVAILCAALLLALLRLGSSSPVPGASAGSREPPADAASEDNGWALDGSVVRLRVTAFPAEARISLDGQRLPSNPYLGSYERDDEHALQITAEANGYHPVKRYVLLDQDQDLVVTLIRSEIETAKQPPRAARGPRPATPAPAQSPATRDETSVLSP